MQISKTAKKFALLGAVVLGVYALSSLGGWYAQRRLVVSQQRGMIAKLEEIGAHYYYDFQLLTGENERLEDVDSDRVKTHWLASYFGPDWFHDLFYVSFAQFDSFQQDGGVATKRHEIGDELFIQLGELQGLRWLAASGTGITDRGLQHLASLGHLERLWLSQTQITDQGLMSLKSCQSLEHLAIEATPTSDRGLGFVVRLPQLEFLSLGSPYLTSSGLGQLANAISLKQLYLDRLPVDEGVLASISRLTRLELLSLRQTPISDAGISTLANLVELKDVRLDGTLVTDRALATARNWSQLQKLSLAGTLISDDGLLQLASCAQLDVLNLLGTRCSLEGVLNLLVKQQHRSVEDALRIAFGARQNSDGDVISLDLSSIKIGDDDISRLGELKKIQWLEIPNNSITDVGASRLANLKFLELNLLRLDGAQITDRGLVELTRIPTLRNLHIAGTQVSEDAIQLAQANAPSLRIYRSDPRSGKLNSP